MKKCNNCGTKSCANNGKIGVPIGCNDYTPPMPQTNADRIRAMTDEELAEYLDGVCHDLWQLFVKDPRKMWLDWLKSPVEPVEVDSGKYG